MLSNSTEGGISAKAAKNWLRIQETILNLGTLGKGKDKSSLIMYTERGDSRGTSGESFHDVLVTELVQELVQEMVQDLIHEALGTMGLPEQVPGNDGPDPEPELLPTTWKEIDDIDAEDTAGAFFDKD